jgi:predicted metalloprotease with PDZ domain
MPYNEEIIINLLHELMPYDWQELIEDRVRGYHKELPLEVLDRLGYEIQYKTSPTDYDDQPAYTPLGLHTSSDGTIVDIVPESLADKAKLYKDAKIIGINNRKFSLNRLKDAIEQSKTEKTIEFLLLEGDEFKTVTISYDKGLQYIDLVPKSNQTNYLKQILRSTIK